MTGHSGSEPALPVSDGDAGRLLAPLADYSHLLLAVSGGPDSMALLGLVASWRASFKLTVTVATVDHGLRQESADEAALVQQQCRYHGVPHAILPWVGHKPQTGLQAAARAARYSLLRQYAAGCGADCLVSAHHGDDQAETVLMRLISGSGLGGLAGMHAQTHAHGLALVRPLLSLSKTRLIATCDSRGWPYVLDRSNTDLAFARARYRRLLPLLAEEGLSAERLQTLARRAGRADAALDAMTDAIWQQLVTGAGANAGDAVITVSAAAIFAHPDEIVLRLVARGLDTVIMMAGLPDVPERLERMERLASALQAAHARREATAMTLRGVAVRLDGAGRLTFAPAPPRRVKGDASNSP
ncbi:MAG: tRNA lysidine(34) synthetase TilS [Beijerinckiaceae bacterium]